jgi:hypothetical protein
LLLIKLRMSLEISNFKSKNLMENLVNELFLVKSLIDINLFYSVELKCGRIHFYAHSGGKVLTALLKFARFGGNSANGGWYVYGNCTFNLVKYNNANGHVK